MKKAVGMVTVVLYCVTIAFVGFFGLRMVIWNEIQNPAGVIFIHDHIVETGTGDDRVRRIFVDRFNTIELHWEVFPYPVTDDTVQLIYDDTTTNTVERCYDTRRVWVTIDSRMDFTLTIRTTHPLASTDTVVLTLRR